MGVSSLLLLCMTVSVIKAGIGPTENKARLFWDIFDKPLPPTTGKPILVSLSLITKKTTVIDLSGGDCVGTIPPIGPGFCGLVDSALEYVQDTLVLCNVYRPFDSFDAKHSMCYNMDAEKFTNLLTEYYDNYPEDLTNKKADQNRNHLTPNGYCIGTRKSSPAWVQLPPLIDDRKWNIAYHSGTSVNINDTILLLGTRSQRVKINKSKVTLGQPVGDGGLYWACSVYDDQNQRILHFNYGTVYELDESLKFPSKMLTTKFTQVVAPGCAIVDIYGKQSLLVAGGFSGDYSYYDNHYYADYWNGFYDIVASTTVEYIPLEDITDGKPRQLSPTKLKHAVWPAVTQVGSEIYIVGGLLGFETTGNKFIEKWDGEDWKIVDINTETLDQQTNTRNVFLEKSFCSN